MTQPPPRAPQRAQWDRVLEIRGSVETEIGGVVDGAILATAARSEFVIPALAPRPRVAWPLLHPPLVDTAQGGILSRRCSGTLPQGGPVSNRLVSSGDVLDYRRASAARVAAIVLATTLQTALVPAASPAGVVVLCTPVDCEDSEECGVSGECFNGTCVCNTQADCPPGSVCLGSPENICVTCPSTPTATATQTATVTATATASATVTATPTPQSTGAACTSGSQCMSGFCVDQVCCDVVCDLPSQRCDLPENPGICTATGAPAPALSGTGLFVAALALLAVGGVALWTRRRQEHRP